MKRIAVFCGASKGIDPTYEEAARYLGRLIVERGCELVYGGGRIGLMGVLADSALAAGGRVIGVIPEALSTKELAHRGIQDLRVVASMHERKALMTELSDAFVVMPGGLGTLDEFFEIWTWAQLGFHKKPYGLLNVGGYYNLLVRFLEHSVLNGGFMEEKSFQSLSVENSPSALLDRLEKFVPSDLRREILKSA